MSTSGQKRIESTIDTAIDCDEDEVMELAMQAGELLLENGAEQFKDLIYEAMAAERPDLYKEVKKFIKSKAKEGKA